MVHEQGLAPALRIAALAVLLSSCDSPTVPAGVVRGDLLRGQTPAAGAQVTLGGSSTVTNQEGAFQFSDVTDGDYTLTATYSVTDSGEIARSIPVSLAGTGVDLGAITLPEPVTLGTTEIRDRSVSLAWTPSDDPGFREYRLRVSALYSSLDETTGQLVHVETDPAETTFFHGVASSGVIYPGYPVRPNTPYFYRVFVLDEYGLLGGSNVAEAHTLAWPTDDFDVEYSLVQSDQFSVPSTLGGIVSDGTCLWIVYGATDGQSADVTRLACYDQSTGLTGVEFDYSSSFGTPLGIAWDGTYLWILFRNYSTGVNTVRALDAADGSVVRTLGVSDDAVDLSWDGQSILVARHEGWIEFVSPINGGLLRSLETPVRFGSLQSVAHHDGEIWLGGTFDVPEILILDVDGNVIGVARTPPDPRGLLEFAGDDLWVAAGTRGWSFGLTSD